MIGRVVYRLCRLFVLMGQVGRLYCLCWVVYDLELWDVLVYLKFGIVFALLLSPFWVKLCDLVCFVCLCVLVGAGSLGVCGRLTLLCVVCMTEDGSLFDTCGFVFWELSIEEWSFVC